MRLSKKFENGAKLTRKEHLLILTLIRSHELRVYDRFRFKEIEDARVAKLQKKSKNLPKKMKHRRGGRLEKTIYGSYVDPTDDGMSQQKNAMSYKEAIKYGYRSC
jgi:hypothetical protein